MGLLILPNALLSNFSRQFSTRIICEEHGHLSDAGDYTHFWTHQEPLPWLFFSFNNPPCCLCPLPLLPLSWWCWREGWGWVTRWACSWGHSSLWWRILNIDTFFFRILNTVYFFFWFVDFITSILHIIPDSCYVIQQVSSISQSFTSWWTGLSTMLIFLESSLVSCLLEEMPTFLVFISLESRTFSACH